MPLILLWALAAAGVTIIVTQSSLFLPLRTFLKRWEYPGKLIKCPMCFGFWTGVLLSLVGLSLVRISTAVAGVSVPAALGPWTLAPTWPWWLAAWVDGAASSALCWITHVVLSFLMKDLDL